MSDGPNLNDPRLYYFHGGQVVGAIGTDRPASVQEVIKRCVSALVQPTNSFEVEWDNAKEEGCIRFESKQFNPAKDAELGAVIRYLEKRQMAHTLHENGEIEIKLDDKGREFLRQVVEVMTGVRFGEMYKEATSAADSTFLNTIVTRYATARSQRSATYVSPDEKAARNEFVAHCKGLNIDAERAYPVFPKGSYDNNAHDIVFKGDDAIISCASFYLGYLVQVEGRGRGNAPSV